MMTTQRPPKAPLSEDAGQLVREYGLVHAGLYAVSAFLAMLASKEFEAGVAFYFALMPAMLLSASYTRKHPSRRPASRAAAVAMGVLAGAVLPLWAASGG